MTCRKCGAELPDRGFVPGRPLLYCSIGCRRAAEHEVRRLDRSITAIEDRCRAHREWLALRPTSVGTGCCALSQVAEHLAVLDAELLAMETRLQHLLDDSSLAPS